MAFGSPFGRPLRLPFGMAIAAIRTLISDTFTDTTGTSLDAHVIAPTNTPATTWTERTGNWQITSNRAVLAATTNSSNATVDAGIADARVSAIAQNNAPDAVATRDSGVAVRHGQPYGGTAGAFYRVGINAFGDVFRLLDSSGATRASASVTISPGTDYAIVVACSGNTISATLDGANTISYASATTYNTSTHHGIMARTAGSDQVDNFTVEAL